MAPDRQWEQLSYHLNIPSFPTQLSSQPYNIFSESPEAFQGLQQVVEQSICWAPPVLSRGL